MKRIIAVILAGVICLGLIGCNNSQVENTDTLHKTISIVQNNNANRITAEDENYIYFYDVNEILKMSKTDSSVETVYIFEGDNLMQFNCIEYFDNALYMIGIGREFGVMQLATVKTDGTGMNKIILEDTNQMPNFYTHDNILYLDYYWLGNDRSYALTPETLELEIVEKRTPIHQTMISDGSSFAKAVEDGCGRLYKTDPDGNTELFLNTDESVFAHHITDYYVFYILIDPVKMDKWEVYRCDVDGSNETFIKEIALMNMGGTSFDNKYYYISEVNGPLWKINKETLEITDISIIEGVDFALQEVNNEKMFYSFTSDVYYIDTVTGEKVEF